jgi:thiamine monophosphate synthase
VRHAARTVGSAAGQATVPIVAIGGITLDRVADVLAAGAASVAVISDLLRDDPERMVRAFSERLAEVPRSRDV